MSFSKACKNVLSEHLNDKHTLQRRASAGANSNRTVAKKTAPYRNSFPRKAQVSVAAAIEIEFMCKQSSITCIINPLVCLIQLAIGKNAIW